MKKLLFTLFTAMQVMFCSAQRTISDGAVTNQQERMVYKQWDRDKFTPKPGFLGLNPNYWLTWALHPNYPKTDLRPLGPSGPQTQRLGLVIAMAESERRFRLHSDTLRQQALIKASAYSGMLSDLDPLWNLYYRHEFSPLLVSPAPLDLGHLGEKERQYLISSGLSEWYSSERNSLAERLFLTRKTTLERSERLLSYQRLLMEYRTIEASWSEKKRLAWKYISISSARSAIRDDTQGISPRAKGDIEIADRILKHSKL
ncbi:hypothetical protein [Pedobacter psychrodurus]|uniref:hypothetical protein n=1 Tax=Pedobacter psychrodurus TaxID=2530456 RepID=UPI00292E1D42|nr:hypothetical protein [Pedobacter psychrodurus]